MDVFIAFKWPFKNNLLFELNSDNCHLMLFINTNRYVELLKKNCHDVIFSSYLNGAHFILQG